MGIPSSNKAESLSRLPQAKTRGNNHNNQPENKNGGDLLWLPENGRVCNHGGDNIRIHIGSRPSVFEVTFPSFLCIPANSN